MNLKFDKSLIWTNRKFNESLISTSQKFDQSWIWQIVIRRIFIAPFFHLSYIYKNGRSNVCLSVCWYVEAYWRSKPLHGSRWNFAHTSPSVQARFWCRCDPHLLSNLCLGGLKPKKLKNTFLNTVYKTKKFHQVAN